MNRRSSAARRRVPGAVLVASAAALIFLAGCATPSSTTSRPVPGWVLEPPATTDEYEYFVVVGEGDNAADAEQHAAAALVTRINQALGVDVTVLTTSEARSSLDSYDASVTAQVTQSGSGRVEGLRIADRYETGSHGAITVYLLGEYERDAFERERTDRRRLAAQRVALYEQPEREADADATAGRVQSAFQGYLNAALAAATADGEGVRGAGTALVRSARKASDTVAGASLKAISGPSNVMVGERPAAPVVFVISDRAGRPVAGAPIEVSYTDAKRVVHRADFTADASGRVSFTVPAPSAIGALAVTARIDTSSYDEKLRRLAAYAGDDVAAIEASLTSAMAVWQIDVTSRALHIPTTIAVVDADANGGTIPDERTGAGITDALSSAGFALVANPVASADQVGLSRPALLEALRNRLPVDVKRVVIGEARITDYTQGSDYLVRVSGTVTVVDLNTEEILYSTSGVKNARSGNADAALDTAFYQLGRSLGSDLAANLR